ncbi:hypothetical protein L1987_36181 [Smallanthus sonchifolius]|uniref:Uncharacterized protein n=1 Tax=Smallanthus sonchifolius TaxID=185202 RepID=A0ACB9HDC5_9ASTR|nr:hypothetical protein L1987_36181 [Smallanthus sonchifolius]
MNTTINAGEPPYTAADTANTEATIPYGLGFFFVILFLLVTLCYGSYIYKSGTGSRRAPARATITHQTDNNHHVIGFAQGLDDNVLMTFPTFVYSQAMMTNKGDASTDANNSGCSICLGKYKPEDAVRLLPECGHLFHVSCIDTWLKVHPTCPVCRNSPLPTD